MGRLEVKNVCLNGDCGYGSGFAAYYDLAGNMVQFGHPDDFVINQTFDAAGRLNSIDYVNHDDGSLLKNIVKSTSYLPDGSPYMMTLGNGIAQAITKDSRLRVSEITNSANQVLFPNANVLDHKYSYGGNCAGGIAGDTGNICSITDTLNGSKSQGFTYDSLNRIAQFNYGNVPNQQYQTDPFGNMTGLSGSTPLLNFNTANQITNMSQLVAAGNCAYSGSSTSCMPCPMPYDQAGNLLCNVDQNSTLVNYTYDAEGRMNKITDYNTGVLIETYSYAADGSRAVKGGPFYNQNNYGNATEYFEWGGQPVAELGPTGWVDYVVANGQKIARITPAPVLHLSGTCGNCSGGASNYAVTSLATYLGSYVIQTGDKLAFQQKQSVANGGLYLFATDGTNSFGTLVDQNGDSINASMVNDGTWHARIVPLDNWANKTISMNLGMSVEASTPTGVQYDSWIADVVLVTAGGASIPMFTGQPTGASPVSSNGGSVYDNPSLSDAAIAVTFTLGDHLGSASMQMSAAGWPTSSTQYMPFGGEINPQGTTDNHYKFTGKERDSESGLDYFGARYYGNSMGRFMSPDWSAQAEPVPYASLGDPQSLNLYAYVRNNPLNRSDPDGHDSSNPELPKGLDGGDHEALDDYIQATHQAQGQDQQNHKAQRQSSTQPQHKGFKHTVLGFLGRHKTTFKVTSRVVIGATVISGVVDGGASELAVPEEVAGEAALETAVETETEGAAEEAGAKAVDNLKSIEKAQQRIRSGSDGGKRIIDVIRKSEDRVKNLLDRITKGDYNPHDW